MADPTVTPLFGVPVQPQAPVVALQPAGAVTAVPASAVVTGGPPAPAPDYTAGLTDEDRAWKARHSGVAGVARSILGHLGDFLMSRLHMGTPYQDSQKQHQFNYAFDQGGNSSDPSAQLHAIGEVERVDRATGIKLRDQFIDNQRQLAQQASTQEARETRLGIAQQAENQRTRGYAAAMLGSMAGWDETRRQANYPAMRERVIAAGQRRGLDLSTELPEQYDGTALDAFIDQSVPVGTQRAQRLTSDRNEASAATANRRVDETIRHNGVTEDQGQQRVDQGAARVAQGAARVDIARTRANAPPRAERVRPLSSYTGSDGRRRVMMSDGSERVSGQTVRPPAPRTSANAPAVGYRNRNGLTFRGGDPNNRANWN